MKLTKKISISGDWVKVNEDIKDGDLVKILDSGKTISGDYGDREVFSIQTKNGEKNLSFNQTTINNLIDYLGDETENWKEKEAKVFIVKQSVQGKLKNVVYLASPNAEFTEDGFIIKNSNDGDLTPPPDLE
jgi:hypothetical protein